MILLIAAAEVGFVVEEHATVFVGDVVAVVEPASRVLEVSVERDLV